LVHSALGSQSLLSGFVHSSMSVIRQKIDTDIEIRQNWGEITKGGWHSRNQLFNIPYNTLLLTEIFQRKLPSPAHNFPFPVYPLRQRQT